MLVVDSVNDDWLSQLLEMASTRQGAMLKKALMQRSTEGTGEPGAASRDETIDITEPREAFHVLVEGCSVEISPLVWPSKRAPSAKTVPLRFQKSLLPNSCRNRAAKKADTSAEPVSVLSLRFRTFRGSTIVNPAASTGDAGLKRTAT